MGASKKKSLLLLAVSLTVSKMTSRRLLPAPRNISGIF